MRIEDTILIEAPPEAVWLYLVEPDKLLKWYKTFLRFEYVEAGVPGIGSRIIVEEHVPPMRAKMTFEVISLAEQEQFGIRKISGGPLKRYEQWWSIASVNGATRFTFVEVIEMPFGPVGRLLERSSKPRSENLVRAMLATLKTLVERAVPAPQAPSW